MTQELASNAHACKDPFERMLAEGFLLPGSPQKPLGVGKRKRLTGRLLSSATSGVKTHTKVGGQKRAKRGDADRALEKASGEMVELLELGGKGGGSTCHVRASVKDFMWAYSTKAKREIPITKNADGTKREIKWRTKAWKLKRSAVLAAQRGKDRVSVTGIERTALLTVDVDVHGEPDAGRRAEIAKPYVEALMGVAEGFVVRVQVTPRGFHATLILSRVVSVARAAEFSDMWARAALARVGGCIDATAVRLEAFPKLQHDGTGRGCALPIGKGQRLVEADLRTEKHGTRAADLRAILDGERTDPMQLAARLMGLPTVAALPAGRTLLVVVDEGVVRGPDGQVFKEDFVLECLRLLEEGIDDDESWHAVRIMVGACKYAGLSDDETRAAMGVWLRQDGHRATHCQSASKLHELDNKVRTQLRHFRRGLLAERCHENGMDAPRLRGLLYGLAGEAERDIAPEHRKRKPWFSPRRQKPEVPTILIGTDLGRFMAA